MDQALLEFARNTALRYGTLGLARNVREHGRSDFEGQVLAEFFKQRKSPNDLVVCNALALMEEEGRKPSTIASDSKYRTAKSALETFIFFNPATTEEFVNWLIGPPAPATREVQIINVVMIFKKPYLDQVQLDVISVTLMKESPVLLSTVELQAIEEAIKAYDLDRDSFVASEVKLIATGNMPGELMPISLHQVTYED